MRNRPGGIRDGKRSRRSQLSRRLLARYFFILAAYVIGLAGFVLLGWRISGLITWQADSLVYQLLIMVKENILFFMGMFLLGGWTYITYYHISKPLRYLDEIVTASERLAKPSQEAIILPPELAETENELNLVRERALADARAAREAEQRKNDLVVYLAHDLKTPLTSVIGYLTLLRDEPQISPELQSRYTGIALSKAERLEDLINEFFDITRFSLTHLTLEEETVSLTRMLEQAAYEFQPALSEKSLEWDMRLSGEIALSCDPDKLQRVFDNLFRNAVHYSYPGTKITLTLEAEDGTAVVQVKNQGKTIPPEKLSRIFEQFFRLDSSRATSTGGAGLGLAIAREIVELHRGTITAESEKECVVFTVRLPLEEGIFFPA